MSLEKSLPLRKRTAKQTIKDEKVPLSEYFLSLDGHPNFPYTMALHSLENLEETTDGKDELYQYLLEDIIFSSIYATFYETLFVTIKNNPNLSIGLVNSFEKNSKERERLIGEQTEYHVDYILNQGFCQGCSACEHHSDVAELLERWQRGDIEFIMTLYIGMQAIQFSMEYILYDIVPTDRRVITQLTQDNIMKFRQFIYNYVESRSK